jgi:putative FmdB family regulatory protein
MPTYDYECPVCKHRFELFSKVDDMASKACPRCGKKRAKRLIGAGAGFIFKGSGFYVTDSRKSSGGNGASVKPDAKSAAKSDAKSTLKGGEASPSGPAATSAPESKPKRKAD